MKINYMVSKEVREPHKKRKIVTTTGSIEVDQWPKTDEEHRAIRQLIHNQHPGWVVAGYSPAKPDLEGEWECPRCGEMNDDCVASCSKCGQEHPEETALHSPTEPVTRSIVESWEAERDAVMRRLDHLIAKVGRVIQERNEALEALEDLVARCDGDEGVRTDGSNIQTMRARVVLAKADLTRANSLPKD